MKSIGNYSKNQISSKGPNINDDAFLECKNAIPHFQDQAEYVYSFAENRMLYANGWEELLGYKDEEMSMLKLVDLTAPEHALFANELNDKALMFINSKTERLTEYGFTVEVKKMHKSGEKMPLFSRVSVYKATDGNVLEIIGISQKMETLRFGNVMHYAAYGPDKDDFEAVLNLELFNYKAISTKEKEALTYASRGYAFKEIADILGVSQSAIEKRIFPLYKRFEVRSLPHLISFAYENNIL